MTLILCLIVSFLLNKYKAQKENSMKSILLTLLCVSQITYAAQIVVSGACSKTPLLKESLSFNGEISAGEFTVESFKKFSVPFEGSVAHVASIYNSPMSLDAMEVISDTKLRSHGWCFSINGVLAEKYPNEVSIKNTDTVHWFYGYASYDSGVWSGMCQPTNDIQPTQFCD